MMYLYAEANGKKVLSKPIEAMSHETTRALLQAAYNQGAAILSPLEAKRPGPITVVTVYGSRSKDGLRRITQIEQWGVQYIPPAEHTGERLSQDEIRHMAEHIYRWTFKHLIQTTAIGRPEAMHMAVDSANTYAEALGLELCRCGTPVRDDDSDNGKTFQVRICRRCGNPIDHALTGVNL